MFHFIRVHNVDSGLFLEQESSILIDENKIRRKKCQVILIMKTYCPGQLVGVLPHIVKGDGFNSQSGHIRRLLVWSWVGAYTRGKQLIFLSLSLFNKHPQMRIFKN